jgi:peptidoglycan/xylan/chitin deacetylase (PgdA/CDA1 family)
MITRLQLLSGQLYPYMHALLRRQFPLALWMGSPDQRAIALTFDDGPHPHDTPQVLAVLAKHHVRATFFWLGNRIEELPTLAREVAAADHQLAIHGYAHHAFPLIPIRLLAEHLTRTRRLLAEASGREPAAIRAVRPPFGLFTPATLAHLTRWGYRPVMWSIVPLHWLQSAQQTIDHVVEQTTAGAVIVLHEGQRRGPAVAELTDAMITRLVAAQFQFVTIDQMWQARAQPDESYGE